MNKYISDNELLSAYIDGELSTDEKNHLEERLSRSEDLRKKLDELKKIQELTKSSLRELPEDTYFETRFFAELKGTKTASRGFRRYIPALGFSLLAAALMIILKLNPGLIDTIVEEQKTNFASFYKENLKPLLYAADLTNEDIFNFAFSNTIPLDDEDKQVLELGYDESGKEFFEIRKAASLESSGNNLEKFVQALSLNPAQKKQVDSILESYAGDLQTQILVNDKNTLAINPNLWNYNKAIAAELISFAAATNKDGLKKMMPSAYAYSIPKRGELRQFISEVKTGGDNEYIFFTPDSIFSEVYEFDKGKFRVEMEQMKKELAKEMKEVEREVRKMSVEIRLDSNFTKHHRTRADKKFKVYVDSNSYRVMVPVVPQPGKRIPMLDSLNVYMENLAENMKHFSFKFELPNTPESEIYKYDFNDSLKSFNFSIPGNVKVPDIDSLLKDYYINMDSLRIPGMNFYYNTDSLTSKLRFFMNDSIGFNHMEFRKQMEELEEEMKYFREEMHELRKDLNKEKKNKTTVKKPIEI